MANALPPVTGLESFMPMLWKQLGIVFFVVILVVITKAYLEKKLEEIKRQKEKIEPEKWNPDLAQFRRRSVLSPHEMKLWIQLYEVCRPMKLVPLAQVGFPAFMDAGNDFLRISQKRADFVICSEDMDALAVIELDDSSHRDKEAEDAARDKMIRSAGIEAIRYAKLPTRSELLMDLMKLKKGTSSK